jgi:hypothetical protein
MPTKRKSRFSSGGHLTDDMAATLVFDSSLAAVFRDGPEPGVEEQREAWSKHRAELMKPETHDLPAGCRPSGFWRFDQNIDPPPDRWCAQIPLLLERGLIDGTEALLVEKGCLMLAPAAVVPSGPHSDAALDRSAPDPDPVSRRWSRKRRLEEARCCAAWHRWRGRLELAAGWAATAAEVEAAMAADQ